MREGWRMEFRLGVTASVKKKKKEREKNGFKKMQPIINTEIGLAWGYLEAQCLGERKED